MRWNMKEILERWDGKFKIGNDVCVNLDNLKVKDGEDFHVQLLSKRREIHDEDMYETDI